MKIIIVGLLKLGELPPAVTLLKELSNHYDVIYYGIDDPSEHYDRLFNHRVDIRKIIDKNTYQGKGFFAKVRRFLTWRLKKITILNATKNIIRQYDASAGDIFWVLHEFTLLQLSEEIKKIPFNLTMYELHKDIFKDHTELKKRIQWADKVIVPEYARAAIVQACCSLKRMPYIIPNKPYEFDESDTYLEDNPMKELVDKAHKEGKKVILYSGIFLRERKIDTIIQAVERNAEKYVIALIGKSSEYLEELLEKYSSARYLGFVTPPKHLSMVECADIGILTYVSDSESINPVFCAPNKIWEYAKYGIPMICNDIPGLKYSVEYNGFGYCCDIDDVNDISEKLNKICENYGELSEKATEYYHGTDVVQLIRGIVNEAD